MEQIEDLDMIPYDQLSHPMNMKGIGRKSGTKLEAVADIWYRCREKIADRIPYSVSFWYQDQTWLHPTRVFENIQHIFKWVPLLWEDRDWDYVYLYKVMSFKLSMMERNHRENKVIGDWKKVADEIKTARGCLDRLIADDYCKDEYKEHNRKFPSKKRWDIMRASEPDKNGCKTMPRMSNEELKSFRAVSKKEESLRQSDLALFCKTFTDYSRGWWD